MFWFVVEGASWVGSTSEYGVPVGKSVNSE